MVSLNRNSSKKTLSLGNQITQIQYVCESLAIFSVKLIKALVPDRSHFPAEDKIAVEHQLFSAVLPHFSALMQGETCSDNTPGWEQAQAIWQKLKPLLEAKAAGREALSELLADPEDEDNQEALRLRIKKLLKQDVGLRQDLERLLAQFPEASGGVQINQKVSGSNNQVIGQVTGGVVFGNVSGGNVAIGANAQNIAVEPPSAGAASADAAKQAVKTILILTANPKGSDPLRLAEEVREIGEALARSSQRESFKIVQRSAVRTKDLRQALLEHEPYLVHFSGHGVGQEGAGLGSVAVQRKISRVPEEEAETERGPEGIVLEDVVGQPQLVSGEALAVLFELFAASMEVVVLNSCYSAVQAEEIGKSIPVVVGMRRAIGDRAAITFAQGFYDALFAGQAVEQAFKLGVNSIQLESIPEHLTPVFKANDALVQAAARAEAQGGAMEAEEVVGSRGGGVNVGEMAGGTVVGKADSVVGGDAIDARGAQGFINRPVGDVNMQFGSSSVVNTGDGDSAE